MVLQETGHNIDVCVWSGFCGHMETLQGIIYKLNIMGVPISGPSYIYGDNMSVIHTTQLLEYTLKYKSNYICYHTFCESVAMGESITGHFGTKENCAELATNVFYGEKHIFHVSNLLYDIYNVF